MSQTKTLTNFEKGKALKETRQRLGFTQAQMAAALNLDSSYLSQFENGHRDIDDFYLVRAAEIEKSNSVKAQKSNDALYSDDSLRSRCHQHLNNWFDQQQGDEDQLRWAYVELQRRFPVDGEGAPVPATSKETPPIKGVSSKVAAAARAGMRGVHEETKAREDGQRALKLKRQAGEPSGGKAPRG